MANVKHKIITMPRLQSALDDVMDELDELGLLTTPRSLHQVE